ncbi:putative AlkP superfamily pyrophosphatase or phosphodiesterase [Stella humosa]|uniref:Putative AlkP superfamily pyrophosphatase or phosphodiesterase n=1 Tax=Stella humosa TaxID=94 RepID=A0A3N1KZA6_9PROT|nr:alkaline phosphatase family protein [Stella humosa]ROP83980.1 putative AlkP superfamily pyrophosphatase or phosphodiesterase [Stella humosa]BBK33489.1 alkaline phosphatase family protein [Stella humosa]
MARRAVIVVCDSLRQDLIRPDTAPVLAGLMADACAFRAYRSVFPSTTRTSSASMATGCLPATHGLLGNTMALDEGEGLVCRSVGNPDFRQRMRRATGATLKVPTLAQRLAPHGGAVVMSNVSAGAAYFHDPDGWGYVYHRAGSFGPGLEPETGDRHLAIGIGAEGDRAMTDRFCGEVLSDRRPALGVLWLSEPDHTGHAEPLGSPAHLAAIRTADDRVAQVLATVARLEAAGDAVLVVVCSDHGMETTRRTVDATARLVASGLKDAADSTDIVLAPNGTGAVIYAAPHARDRGPALRRFLEAEDWVGRVFAGPELAELGMPAGGDVLLALTTAADDEPNGYGVRGRADIVADPESSKSYDGFGQHGGIGVNEQNPFLVVRGGGFATARATDHPASLIDIAPTVLRHLGQPAEGMDGRALPLDPPQVV